MSWLAEGQASDLSSWVGNGRGSLDWVASGGRLWPVSLGDARQGRDATWLTSLVSALVGTPKEEAAQPDTLAGRLLRTGLGIAERVAIAAGADTAVIVNNSLLSVTPVGPSHLPGLAGALTEAVARWPGRIICARGIVAERAAVQACAARAGGIALPSRVSYAFDLTQGALPDKINAARDAALLKKAGLEVVPHDGFTDADVADARAQYLAVYIGHHGARNPQLTSAFFESAHRARGGILGT